MIGLIIATSVIGVTLVSAIVFGAIKLHMMEKNMNTLGECLLLYMAHPEEIDIIEQRSERIPTKFNSSGNNFNFPNSEGGF